ncbi:glycosyltransferase [Nostoc sp. NIES-2111]
MNECSLSIIICTYNPRKEILRETLDHLSRLELDEKETIELVIVDNASSPPVEAAALNLSSLPFPARVIQEPKPGQMNARLRGFHSTNGEIVLYLDDDNYVHPRYALRTLEFFREHPKAGAISGRVIAKPEFEFPYWMTPEMVHHYAVRDLGEGDILFRNPATPYGAGMAIRRKAMAPTLSVPFVFSGRVGAKLSSGDDCELCYRIKSEGWELWYCGGMVLEHFLYQSRLTAEYYERFQYSLGFDTPVMEMFWAPGRPWRRLTYLKRAALLWWKLKRWDVPVIRGNPAPLLLDRFKRAWHQGVCESLWQLAWGPPIWRQVRTLKPD